MARRHSKRDDRLCASPSQRIVAVYFDADGEERVVYCDEATTEEMTTEDDIEEAVRLAGAWSDLDWQETLAALDRIRHESRPTPPIELRLRAYSTAEDCPARADI